MGQKVNPKIIRIGVINGWHSRWYSSMHTFAKKLEEDMRIRKHLNKKLREAGLDRVEIERNAEKITINIHTAKPGVIIGRGGKGAEDLKKELRSMILKKYRPKDVNLNISEVPRPNLSAKIVAQTMAMDIEKRVPFRKVMKQAIGKVERAGAQGVKVAVKGRLNGAEIARSEKLANGSIPLHTLRADIDYAEETAYTTYGTIGIKIWIYKGEVFEESKLR